MDSYNRLLQLKNIAIAIGIAGGLGIVIAMNSIPSILNKKISNSDHYKQAIEYLYNHPEAKNCLGEPITLGRINTASKDQFGTDGKKFWLVVPVKGSKTKGQLYYDFFINEHKDVPFKLSRVELVVDNFKGYKLLLKGNN